MERGEENTRVWKGERFRVWKGVISRKEEGTDLNGMGKESRKV
jgi:hypothetical protein